MAMQAEPIKVIPLGHLSPHNQVAGGTGGGGDGEGGKGGRGGEGGGGGGHIRDPHLLMIKYPTPQEVRLIDGDWVLEPEQSPHVSHVSIASLIRQPEQLPP